MERGRERGREGGRERGKESSETIKEGKRVEGGREEGKEAGHTHLQVGQAVVLLYWPVKRAAMRESSRLK